MSIAPSLGTRFGKNRNWLTNAKTSSTFSYWRYFDIDNYLKEFFISCFSNNFIQKFGILCSHCIISRQSNNYKVRFFYS